MTETTTTWQTHKTKSNVKLPLSATMVSSGSKTTLSTITFSNKDIAILLEHLMKAMTQQNINNDKSNPSLPGGNFILKNSLF